jgi:pimeloyl-ACP methyl ester carboxylesterase
VDVLNPTATVHGRVLIERAEDPLGALVGFHGYAQTAEDMLVELQQVPGADRWTKVSIQALHPFYIRGDSKVVANWMTRQDRELAIADNIAYVQRAMEHTGFSPRDIPGAEAPGLHLVQPGLHVVTVGFSQGAAMAYRAALHNPYPVAGIVALGGDIPPELKADPSLIWPPVLMGVGEREEWYAGDKLEADLTFLRSRNITHKLVRFDGGHEWTAPFRGEVGRFLASLSSREE